MSKWISIKERLPNEQGKYLVSVDVGSVDIKKIVTIRDFRIKPAYSAFADGDWQKTTHWMPLPEPPEGL